MGGWIGIGIGIGLRGWLGKCDRFTDRESRADRCSESQLYTRACSWEYIACIT
ncbi:MAG: hypothetical protein HC795_11935 [Coleofasciculaceae cyanobacterium RL_1_1]|nr:hypothetical protein [Coleofasciculaceae cyanobacterium RL_1_1]